MKNTNKILLCTFSIVIVCVVLFSAQEKQLPPEIQHGVSIKIEEFKKRKERECRERALEKAITIADSLMKVKAFEMVVDTIDKPEKPVKPDSPEFKSISDTLKVRPLFRERSNWPV